MHTNMRSLKIKDITNKIYASSSIYLGLHSVPTLVKFLLWKTPITKRFFFSLSLHRLSHYFFLNTPSCFSPHYSYFSKYCHIFIFALGILFSLGQYFHFCKLHINILSLYIGPSPTIVNFYKFYYAHTHTHTHARTHTHTRAHPHTHTQ